MSKRIQQLFTCTLIVATLSFAQMIFVFPATAAEGEFGDIKVLNQTSKTEMMAEGFFENSWISVCNEGNASIKSITFQNDTTNWNLTSLTIQERQPWNTATILGEITLEGVWTGQVDPDQCFTIFQWGNITGEIGDDAVHTVSVVSATLYDDTTNVDPDPSDDSGTITLPIVAPTYAVNLTPYIGDSGYTYPQVWDGFVPQYQWINVCSWGIGTVKSFQLDVTTENWTNFTFDVDTSSWSNNGVIDKGSITPEGLWTGQLQVDKCINFRAYGTVEGEIGEDAVITVTVSDAVFVDDTLNVDTNSSDDTQSLVQPIQEPVYAMDLGTYVGNNNSAFMYGGSFSNTWIHVCSTGYGSVESMTFDFETENWTMESIQVESYASEFNSAADLGSISLDGTWNGTLNAGECIVFHADGPITGGLGDTVSWTVEMTSSTLTGGEINPDPVSSNDSMTISAPVAETGDLAIQTRLMTSGDITEGSDVSYEIEIQNIGAGIIPDSMIGLYYILPEGASWIGITDLNPEDELTPLGCMSMGPVDQVAPSLSAYSGEVIQCYLQGPEGGINPGSSYPIQLDLEATEGFTSGDTEVYGVVLSGNIQEPDSATFVMEIQAGRDAFRLSINNIMHLVYDNNDLEVSINRCEGIDENVTVDDACFTVEFSKPVWAASFSQDDLVLVGGGTIYSFVQESSTKWTVRINGMTPGGTLELLIGEASVVDYSAVQNGVEVLGENVVRYAVVDDSGTPANETQSNGNGSSSTSSESTSTNSQAGDEVISNGVSTLDDTVIEPVPLLGETSGLIAEIPKIFGIDFDANLILGKWSITKSNVLDFAFILINLSGLAAIGLVLADKRRRKLA